MPPPPPLPYSSYGCTCHRKAACVYYSPLRKWRNKLRIQMHKYSISLCNSIHHLVNVSELYTCLFSACFHPVPLDFTATEGLTSLRPSQVGMCILLQSVLLQGTIRYILLNSLPGSQLMRAHSYHKAAYNKNLHGLHSRRVESPGAGLTASANIRT